MCIRDSERPAIVIREQTERKKEQFPQKLSRTDDDDAVGNHEDLLQDIKAKIDMAIKKKEDVTEKPALEGEYIDKNSRRML